GDFDQAVNVAVAKLRAALGDSADNPRYVETLPRRGYRFIADVAVVNLPPNKVELAPKVGALATGSAPLEVAGTELPTSLARRHTWKTLLLVAVLLLLGVVAWIFIARRGQPANTSLASPVHSLAVLPLENLSSDSQDYFADGM